MNDYIRRAFKSLEDLQVVIEPVKSALKEDLEIETEIKEEPETVRDLFESERSYIITHDFEDDGISYSLFLEALNDGESCDIEFEVFDIENITEVLVEVLDSEHEFLGSLVGEDITLDTPFEKVIKEAKAFINGEELPDEEEVAVDTEVSSEEPEANDREFISDETEVEVTEEELLTEEDKDCKNCNEDKDCEDPDCKDEECCDEECKECKEECEHCDEEKHVCEKCGKEICECDKSLKESKDEIEEYLEVLIVDGKRISCIDTFDVEDVQEAIAAAKEAGADKVVRVTRINKADGSFDYDDKKERVIWTKENNINEEQLSESKKYDLYDDEEVEEADKNLDELKNSTSKDEIMQIVDASAESTDELRDSYIGGMVLQCPVCKATMFKDMDQLVKEEDEDLYNVEEECPHCGSKGGFELIGQLAKPNVNPFAEEEAPVEEPAEEKEEVKIEAEPLPELPSEEEVTELDLGKQESLQKTGNVILESLDESKFDRLVIKYLKETYTNIRSYKTTDAAVDDNNNKIIIEGLITFNSGKEKKTTFVFEAKEITNKNQLKLVGMNETFTTGKAFTLLAGTENGRLLSESLSYRYTIDDKKVKGKATSFQKR